MSSRDDWVPLVAGVVVGAGLLAVLYKLFFTGPQPSYAKGCNQNFGASKYVCTCPKDGQDFVSILSLNCIHLSIIT